MSHLDRAFIRAYARETAGLTVHRPHCTAPVAASNTDSPPNREPVAAEQSPATPAAEQPSVDELYAPQVAAPAARVETSTVPAPHAPFFAANVRRSATSAHEQSVAESTAQPALPEATETPAPPSRETYFRLDSSTCAPLSSFLLHHEPADADDALTLTDLEAAARADGAAIEPVASAGEELSIEPTDALEPLDEAPRIDTGASSAAFEVRSFCWPDICKSLVERLGPQLDQLTSEIAGAATRGHNIIAFTGCQSGAGSTSLLLCVARRLADAGRRVALVDGDFEEARLAEQLGLAPETGWADVLQRDEPLAEALIESIEDRLSLLPLARPVAPGQQQPLGWFDRLRSLGADHDLVLLDSGLLQGAGGAWSCPTTPGRGADGTILVMDMRSTDHEMFAAARTRLDEAQLTWWGAIENFAPAA